MWHLFNFTEIMIWLHTSFVLTSYLSFQEKDEKTDLKKWLDSHRKKRKFHKPKKCRNTFCGLVMYIYFICYYHGLLQTTSSPYFFGNDENHFDTQTLNNNHIRWSTSILTHMPSLGIEEVQMPSLGIEEVFWHWCPHSV